MSEQWKMNGKPGLIILHMQVGIRGNGTFIPNSWDGGKDYKESGVMPQLRALLNAFRKKKLPRIFVSAMPNPLGTLPAYGSLYRGIEAANINALFPSSGRLEVIQNGIEVIPEMNRQPDEPLLVNWLLGGFTNSGLNEYLMLNDVKTVVLAGYALSMVVYTTAVQAADLWYSCIIPRDASTSGTSAISRQADAAVLDIMAPKIALVTTTNDVIDHLS